ncbi:MAG: 16S rRNA (cytidine(1402)-2'-O)-methyltransferase [Nanoarchaeota archaeon]|nr:16S rRNA (cytidine(1402)-2'-O)-methyltransferase [Nanoarchaeota archaeon]
MLYICATPIGNLDDVSSRLISVLRTVDLICAEDTRRIKKLLSRYEIKGKKTISYNDRNKERRTKFIIDVLKKDHDVALVSDAGTPGISDPGFYLVREAAKEKLDISPVPGPSAAIAALSISGLPTNMFTFYGFLKKKQGKREETVSIVKERNETSVFYESQYRIEKTMEFFAEHLPDRPCMVCRELTKKFEEIFRSTVSEIKDRIVEKKPKGEFVIIIGKK